MKKVKGIKKLNKAITAPLKKRFGIAEAICSDEYAYYFDSETITYKLEENMAEDLWYIEFVKDRFDYKVEYPFIMSILHEVGHHKANEEICDAIADFCETEKERIEAEMENATTEDELKRLELQYFNLPDEIMATQWAVNYMKRHPTIIRRMWNEMRMALVEFYKVNGVTED